MYQADSIHMQTPIVIKYYLIKIKDSLKNFNC